MVNERGEPDIGVPEADPAAPPKDPHHWGAVLVASILALLALWYALDTWRATSATTNLIYVFPLTLLVVVLYVAIIVGALRAGGLSLPLRELRKRTSRVPLSQTRYARALLILFLFIMYAALLPNLGLDVGTFLFLGVTFFLLGERNPMILIAYPAGFAIVATYAFRLVATFPLPTLLL